MNDGAVVRYVTENPGTHFNTLVDQLDITPDRLHRVSKRLSAEGTLTVAEFYGKTHYYPPGFDEWQQQALSLVRRETSRDILFHLIEHEPSTPADVTDDVGIARSTLEWHLDRLIDADLVRKERDGWAVELRIARPEQTRQLLEAIEPTLLERWVDRTTRLFDHLIDESQ